MFCKWLVPVALTGTLLIPQTGATEAVAAGELEEGIAEIARQLSLRLVDAEVKKIAIVNFPDLNGYQSALGQFIAEELITQFALADSGRFNIVERRQLARVLAEQELSDSSLFDPESIASIGKILGIEAIVTGSISDLGSEVKINARVISVETARVFAAASSKIPKDDVVTSLMRQNAGGAIGAGSGITSPARQVQSASATFDNPFLHVEVRSISRSADHQHITLALDLSNVGSEDLLLSIEDSNGCSSLIDDRGNSSVSLNVSGLACVYYGNASYENSHSHVAPGSRTTVTFVYDYSEKVTGASFSFSASFLRHLGGEKWQRFSVGIANIQMPD